MLAEHEPPIVLHLGPVLRKMNAHEFFQLCRLNPDWRLERTCEGDLVIMPPTGGKTGQRNFTLTALFGAWVQADGTGVGFDSSTGFTLPNGAQRSRILLGCDVNAGKHSPKKSKANSRRCVRTSWSSCVHRQIRSPPSRGKCRNILTTGHS